MKTMYHIVYRNLKTMVIHQERTTEEKVQAIVNNPQLYWVYAIRFGV